jgi:hypothetical protein
VPNYIVKILKFDCLDESGVDWLGSDEPLWVFTANAAGKASTTRSMEFGDVDSGDTVKFKTDNNRNTVWPSKGSTTGAAGPIALSIQLWEIDQGNPDTIAAQTEDALTAAAVAATAIAAGTGQPEAIPWIARVRDAVRGPLTNLIADDLMGSATLLWPVTRLRNQLPQPGSSFIEKRRFGGHSGDLPFEIAGGPDYDLYLQVTRVS